MYDDENDDDGADDENDGKDDDPIKYPNNDADRIESRKMIRPFP